MVADTMLPPTIDQGWAKGLAGTAKSNTADAPSAPRTRVERSQRMVPDHLGRHQADEGADATEQPLTPAHRDRLGKRIGTTHESRTRYSLQKGARRRGARGWKVKGRAYIMS